LTALNKGNLLTYLLETKERDHMFSQQHCEKRINAGNILVILGTVNSLHLSVQYSSNNVRWWAVNMQTPRMQAEHLVTSD